MLWRMFFFAAVAAATAGKAEACTYSAFTEHIGPRPTAREIADDERNRARQLLLRNTRDAQRRLARGTDPAAELAEMLVPNIEPVHIDRGGCDVSEIDWAHSGETPYEPLAGTAFAGREKDFRPIVVDYGPSMLGPDCNAEFRGLFAEHLRRRLTPAQMKRSYVFLAVRRPGGPVQRLMAFRGKVRRPPVHWVADAQIHGWARRAPSGRALSRAIADFWREMEPRLSGPATSCPAAFADWRRDQADLVARIERSIPPGKRKP